MAEAGRAACSFAVPVRPAGASVQPWQPVFPPRRTNATRLRVPRATGQLPCRLACAAQAGNPAFWDPVAIAGFSSTDPGAPPDGAQRRVAELRTATAFHRGDQTVGFAQRFLHKAPLVAHRAFSARRVN